MLPGAGLGLMAYGAWHGYQTHGVKGAVLGTIGAEGVLDIGKNRPAAGPQRLSAQQQETFRVSNAAHASMQKANTGSGEVRTFERNRRIAGSGVVVHETVRAHRRSAA